MFWYDNHWDFSTFSLLFHNLFQKTGLKVLRLKLQHFHTELSCQKPMLRETGWGE